MDPTRLQMIDAADNPLADVAHARQDYRMAARGGHQRRDPVGVPWNGHGADYHYRRPNALLRMQELAWDIYRDNMAIGSITDRAIENWLQGGFKYNPNTGDQRLDRDIEQWWADISDDPREIDPAWENDFSQMTELVARSATVAGDVFGVPIGGNDDLDGTVALVEAQLCRSPRGERSHDNIVHGVEKSPHGRRPVAYYFLEHPLNPEDALGGRDQVKREHSVTPIQ